MQFKYLCMLIKIHQKISRDNLNKKFRCSKINKIINSKFYFSSFISILPTFSSHNSKKKKILYLFIERGTSLHYKIDLYNEDI